MLWPIPTLKNEFVCIFFSSDTIACGWIQKTTTMSAPLLLRAYQRYSLDNFEFVHLIPFNLTKIKKYISSFLYEHNLHNAFVIFCLDGIIEQYVALPTSTPDRADFNMPTISGMQWEYRYLYSDHEGHHLFYVYAVAQSLILQYKLLAISAECNLIRIAPQAVALLDAYKNIFGVAYRKSQLAVDMMQHDNNIKKLMSRDAIRRMVNVSSDLEDDHTIIAAMCGMFCAERMP
jgi:hypothetical protein